MKNLDSTLGVCVECGKIIPADIVEEDEKVYMLKHHCKEEKVLIERDLRFYTDFQLPFKAKRPSMKIGKMAEDLTNDFKEVAGSVVYITSQCNMKCPICYEKWAYKFPEPTFKEIEKIVSATNGSYILLNGGEPTCREDLFEIIKMVKGKRKDCLLFTNGLKLKDRRYVKKLREAGIDRVILSFDGFDNKTYVKFRGRRLLSDKMKALGNLIAEKIETTLVPVIDEDNKGQIPKIIEFAIKHNDTIKEVWLDSIYDNSNNPEITKGQMLKELIKATGASYEYLKEYKQFKINLYKLIERYRGEKADNYTMFLYDAFPFKIVDGKLEQLFRTEDLKRLNKDMETENPLNLFSELGMIKKLYDYQKGNGEGILRLYVCSIVSPINTDLLRSVSIGRGIGDYIPPEGVRLGDGKPEKFFKNKLMGGS